MAKNGSEGTNRKGKHSHCGNGSVTVATASEVVTPTASANTSAIQEPQRQQDARRRQASQERCHGSLEPREHRAAHGDLGGAQLGVGDDEGLPDVDRAKGLFRVVADAPEVGLCHPRHAVFRERAVPRELCVSEQVIRLVRAGQRRREDGVEHREARREEGGSRPRTHDRDGGGRGRHSPEWTGREHEATGEGEADGGARQPREPGDSRGDVPHVVEEDDPWGRLRVENEGAAHVERRRPRPERQRLDLSRRRALEGLEAQQREIGGSLHLDREVEPGSGGQHLRTRAVGRAAQNGRLVDSDRVPSGRGKDAARAPDAQLRGDEAGPRRLARQEEPELLSGQRVGVGCREREPEHRGAPASLATLESDGGRRAARGARDKRASGVVRAGSRRRARPRGSDPAGRRRRAPGAATVRVELASIRQYRAARLILHAAGAHTAPPG